MWSPAISAHAVWALSGCQIRSPDGLSENHQRATTAKPTNASTRPKWPRRRDKSPPRTTTRYRSAAGVRSGAIGESKYSAAAAQTVRKKATSINKASKTLRKKCKARVPSSGESDGSEADDH